MKNKSLLTLASLALIIPSQASLYPDEINHPEYKEIFEAAKKISLNLRSLADEKLQIVRTFEQEISDDENTIIRLNGFIAELEDDIDFWEGDIISRERRVTHLASLLGQLSTELSRLRSVERNLDQRIDAKKRELSPEQSRLRRVQNELRITRSDYFESERKLNQLSQDITSLNNKITNLENRRSNNKKKLVATEERLKEQRNRRQNLRQKKRQIKSEISNLENKRSNVKGKLRSVNDQLKPLITERDRLNSQKKDAQGKLTKAQNGLSTVNSNIQKFKNQIGSLNSEISGFTSQIADLESKKQSLPTTIANLQSENQGLNGKLSDLKGEVSTINSEISDLETKISNSEQRLANLNSQPQSSDRDNKIAKVTKRIQNLKKKKSNKVSAKKNKQQNIKGIKNKIAKNNQAIKKNQTLLGRLDKQIARLQNLLSKKKKAKQQAKQAIAQEERKKSGLKSRIATNKKIVQQSEQLLNSVRPQIQALRPEKKRLSDRLQTINGKITQKQTNLTQNQDKLNTLNRNITKNESLVQEIQDLLPKLRNRINRNEQELAQVQRDERNESRRLRSLGQSVSQIEGDSERQLRLVTSLERELRELNQRNSHNNSLISQNLHEIDQAETEKEEHEVTIASHESEISSANIAIAQGHDEIDELEVKLPLSRTSLAKAKNDFIVADSNASAAEAETSNKKSEYLTRKDLFNQYLSEAKGLGESQGIQSAPEFGSIDANVYASDLGTKIGGEIAAEVAKFDGQYRGLILGKLAGNEEGYLAGENSATDFQSGYDSGHKIGLKKAQSEAQKIDFPAGYKSERERLLSKLPPTLLDDKILQMESVLAFADKELIPAQTSSDYRGRTSISQDDIDTSNEFGSDVDGEIAQNLSKLSEYDSSEVNLSEPKYVYTKPAAVQVSEDGKDCSTVYKQVQDFINACSKSYGKTFKKIYLKEHKKVFFEEYSSVYLEKYNDVFEADKDITFDKSFSDSHSVVFQEAKERGAVVAQARGIDEGKAAGYAENISEQKKLAFKKGRKGAQSYFANNAVVRLTPNTAGTLTAKNPKGALQGSQFDLGAELDNLGSKVSRISDARVKIIALTDNVIVKGAVKSFENIPAKKSKKFSKLGFGVVKNDAVPGSLIRLKAIFSYRGDDITSSFKEELVFSAKVMVNPEVGAGYEFDTNPKWRKWKTWPFKWEFRKHDVAINLKGLRNNVPGSYVTKATIVMGEKYIKLLNSEVKIASPGKGATAQGKIRYQFKKKKAKDKDIAIKVTTYYQGVKVAQQTLNMKSQ